MKFCYLCYKVNNSTIVFYLKVYQDRLPSGLPVLHAAGDHGEQHFDRDPRPEVRHRQLHLQEDRFSILDHLQHRNRAKDIRNGVGDKKEERVFSVGMEPNKHGHRSIVSYIST